MSGKDDSADLVGRIYDGALDISSWPDVLDDISAVFNAICCHLFVADPSRDKTYFASLNSRFSIERLKDYHEHYRHIDDRLLISSRMPYNKVYADWEVMSSEDFLKTEFYNDFYLPHGLRWSIFGQPVREESLLVGFSIHRPPGAEPFGRDQLKRAQMLFPHVARAVRLMRQTASAESLAGASEAALDGLPVGLCILDRSGRPVFRNRASRRMIGEADGFGMSRHGLFASLRDETIRLRRAVAGAAKCARPGEAGGGDALTISRPSGKRSYQVIVAPLRPGGQNAFILRPEAAVLVIINDPEARPQLPEEALARFFGFTAAEAKLAIRVMRGQSPQEIAESTRRSVNTVRWMLKNVLAKTGCRRQIDLVRILHSTALACAFDVASSEDGDG